MVLWITFLLILNNHCMASNITLSDLHWKNRVLLVFPSSHDERNMEFEITADLAYELEDRDLLYFYLDDKIKTNSGFSFSADYQKKLKQKFQKGSKKHSYVLIGKDGSSKLTKENNKVDWQEIFAKIDAMPMRIREMKNKPD